MKEDDEIEEEKKKGKDGKEEEDEGEEENENRNWSKKDTSQMCIVYVIMYARMREPRERQQL